MRTLLVLLLAAATLTAGCTKEDGGDGGDGGNTTPTGGGTTTTPPTTNGTTPGGGNAPTTAPVTDAGAVQGPFEKSWTLAVPQVSPRMVTVLFNLTGAQAGVPPTARVHLEFLSPEGQVLKSTDVGLGGSGEAVAWTFGPADVPAPGDYVVRASASATPAPGAPGLPSGGVGNYQFYGHVEY